MAPGLPSSIAAERRALVIAPSWIGDAVLTQPLIARLAVVGSVDVVASPWVAPVYRCMEGVGRVIDNPFGHGELRLLARKAFGRSLADAGYATAYVLPNSLKSALIPWFAGITHIVGYRGEMRGWILSDCRDLDERALPTMAERFAALAVPTDTGPAGPFPQPALRISADRQRATLERLALGLTQPVAALCPGAEYGPAKRWPARHFASLANRLLDEGMAVWLFGGKGDRSICEEIDAATRHRCTTLAGKLELSEAIDLIALARQVVTNDSGLMHIACAVGAPVAAIYGSSSPSFTPPLSARARVVSLQLECSPCFKRQCPLGHMRCLNDLAPQRVRDAFADRSDA